MVIELAEFRLNSSFIMIPAKSIQSGLNSNWIMIEWMKSRLHSVWIN